MALGSSIAAAALWLMVGELMVLLLMVSVQMALGSSIAACDEFGDSRAPCERELVEFPDFAGHV